MNKFISILLISFLSVSLCVFSINKISEAKNIELDNTTISWFLIPNNESKTPQVNDKLNFKLSDYNVIYKGPTYTKQKSLYLTFDGGYENGYTNKILDVLKEKNVKAVFFLTSYYIDTAPQIVKRMVDEGHIVANHSMHHYSMPKVTNSSKKFNKEFTDVEDKFKELTGRNMIKLFRPPMGEYSQKSLSMTKDLGYKSVFWSFAYNDYEPSNQPSSDFAKKNILENFHDGSILLLHVVSKTNAEILAYVIDEARKDGYEFYLLSDK